MVSITESSKRLNIPACEESIDALAEQRLFIICTFYTSLLGQMHMGAASLQASGIQSNIAFEKRLLNIMVKRMYRQLLLADITMSLDGDAFPSLFAEVGRLGYSGLPCTLNMHGY